MKVKLLLCNLLITKLLSGSLAVAQTSEDKLVAIIEAKPLSELWINPGLYSYHYDQTSGLNNNNWGFGAEYRFSTVASVTAGTFRNSNKEQSNYVGVYWQPIGIGPVRIGVVGGGFNGYSTANNGGWFPAVLPALSYEYERVGMNVLFVPTISDRVHGAISLQLKLKIYE